MQQVKSFFTLTLAAFFMAGCFLFVGGHLLIKVSGKIPLGDSNVGHEKCTLEMISEKYGRIAHPEEVTSNISARFLVLYAPAMGRVRYYFLAHCPNNRFFRSHGVVVGSQTTHFDLGTLAEESQDSVRQ